MMNNQDFESISLQWQETIKILIQSFNKILNKYLTYADKSQTIIEKIYEKSFYLFRITNKNIFNEVSIVIKNLLNSNLLSTRKKQTLLEEIESWLKRNKNQGQAVHDMMNVIIMVTDDPSFATDKANFELILRIYVEIVYFAAFSNEYSTYFYNLENMCKSFMKKLFLVNLLNGEATDDLKDVFVKSLPELFVVKVINKKANDSANLFLNVFFDEFEASFQQIDVNLFKKIIDSLYSINKLKNAQYLTFVDSESLCIYITLNRRINQLVANMIALKLNFHIFILLEVITEKFSLLVDPYSLKGLKFRESLIKMEFSIAKSIILYFLSEIGFFGVEDPQYLQRLCKTIRAFNFSYLKIEQMFDFKVDVGLEADEEFSLQLYILLNSILSSDASDKMKFKLLDLILSIFDEFIQKMETNVMVTKLFYN
jgi:hypothetical protein